jgi:hypothetical protein
LTCGYSSGFAAALAEDAKVRHELLRSIDELGRYYDPDPASSGVSRAAMVTRSGWRLSA